MIKVKNLTTGEVINISQTGRDKETGRIVTNGTPSAKFLAKYPLISTGETNAEGDTFMELKVGFELLTGQRRRAPREEAPVTETPQEEAPETEAVPETETAEAPVEMETTIETEAVEEVIPEKPKAKKEPKKASTVPTLDAAAQAFAALTPLFSGVEANVTAAVMERIQPLADRVEAICGRAPQTIVHVIKSPKGEVKTEAGEVFHANFNDVCNRVARGSWVYLYGPTGSGKNVMAEQVARALGLAFHYQAHTLDRFELTGFIDASGCYQPTEFYKAYTEGGLFMLDELDASDENALVTLNSACNGYFAFPCGTVKQHPDFRCIAAGNTCGRGGTDDYTARHTMDISSLGRFIPRYHGYCNEIDMASANGDAELVEFVHALRRVKRQVGCQIIASPRQMKEIVKDMAQEIDLTQTLTDVFGTYLTADELNIVKDYLHNDEALAAGNKYAKAFKKVQAIEY